MSTPPTRSSPRMATGRTTSCCPASCSMPSRPGDATRLADAPRRARPSGSSRPSTATTASRCVPTSTASWSPARCCASPTSSWLVAGTSTASSRTPTPTASTSTSSTAPTTRPSARTTTATSRREPSSSSRGASRRSTTWGCSPARTTTTLSQRTGEGRAINRHDYTIAEVGAALERPVVRHIIELIRLRATHPAFAGHSDRRDTRCLVTPAGLVDRRGCLRARR